MTNLSSSLIIYSFWTHNASYHLVENRPPVRPSRGFELKTERDIKCMMHIGFVSHRFRKYMLM